MLCSPVAASAYCERESEGVTKLMVVIGDVEFTISEISLQSVYPY